MKISTKGRYALRLMLDLAVNGHGKPISLSDVARRQEVSEKYLEQLALVLTRAGQVKSVRGVLGGYLLTRTPAEYTVGEILRAQEGSLAPVACAQEGGSCAREARCVTVDLWRRVRQAVDDVVDSVTLQDLVDDYHAKCGRQEQPAPSGQAQPNP